MMNRHPGRPPKANKRVDKKGKVQLVAKVPKAHSDWLLKQPKGASEKLRTIIQKAFDEEGYVNSEREEFVSEQVEVHSEEAMIPLDERYGVCEMCGENGPAIITPGGQEVPYCSIECAGRELLNMLDILSQRKASHLLSSSGVELK